MKGLWLMYIAPLKALFNLPNQILFSVLVLCTCVFYSNYLNSYFALKRYDSMTLHIPKLS